MATVELKTVDGNKHFEVSGTGTSGDPYVPAHTISGTVDASGSTVDASGSTVEIAASITLSAKDAGFSVDVDPLFTTSADATAGVNITALPTGGQKRVLVDLFVSVEDACEITLVDGAAVTYLGAFLPASSGIEQLIPRAKLKATTVDSRFRIVTSVATEIRIRTHSYSEA